MTIKETNQLIDKFLDGKTSPTEERRLALEVNRKDAPEEWLIIREMLGELTLDEAIYDHEMKSRKRRRWMRYGGWGIAASIALCLAINGVLSMESDEGKDMALTENKMVKEAVVPKVVETTPIIEEITPVQEEIPILEQVEVKPTPRPKMAKSTAVNVHVNEPLVQMEDSVEVPSFSIEDLRAQVTEADLAQVEKNYELWLLKQTIVNEGIELQIATKELEKKYEAHLAENIIEI